MTQVFVEVNPYHAETLFTLYTSLTTGYKDIVLGHERLLTQPFFRDIQATEKHRLSMATFLRAITRSDVTAVTFNTINVTLTPISRETATLAFKTFLLSILARLRGHHLAAILHEADQFLATGLDSGRRTSWFRRAVGQWWIRLFNDLYVLSPEVHRFLSTQRVNVKLLDPEALATFGHAATFRPDADRTVVWVGPVMGLRRSWSELTALIPSDLARMRLKIEMVCDARVAEGPTLRSELAARGLEPYFLFMDYRPDDYELVARVRASAGVLCLYGSPEYGSTKSSGARILAWGLRKRYIANRPNLAVYEPDGTPISRRPTLQDCLELLLSDRESRR
jgi:hypothetical protein